MARTLVVGDSLEVGTAPYLRRRIRAQVDARVGRPSSEGVSVLRRRLGHGTDRVVFDLGTNDPNAGALRQSLRQVRHLVGGRDLYVATVRGPDAAAKNALLKRFARHNQNVHLVHTAGRVQYGPDGIHSTPQGYQQRARILAGAVNRELDSTVASVAKRPSGWAGSYQPFLQEAYRKYGVLPRDEAGLIQVESGGDPGAESPKGAGGTTQFLRSTARSYGVQFGSSRKAIRSQILGSAHYLKDLGYRRNSRAAKLYALAGYNAGPGNRGAGAGYAQTVLAAARQYRGLGRGAGTTSAGGGSSGGAVQVTQPTYSRGQVQAGGTGNAEILAQLLQQQRPVIQSAGVQAPSFAAGPAMPSGYQAPASGGGGVQQDTSLDSLLSQAQALQGAETVQGKVTPGSVSGGRQNGSQGGSGASGGSRGLAAKADGWYGTKTLAETGKAVAAHFGVKISSEKRSRKTTATGNVSDHYIGNKQAWADDYDTPGLDSAVGIKLARRIAKAYGVKFVMNSYASGGTIRVGSRTFRLQILYGSGVQHADHVHVGIKRIL